MAVQLINSNAAIPAYQNAVDFDEKTRGERLRQQGMALQNEQANLDANTTQANDQAMGDTYRSAMAQPVTPSVDPSGAQNLTTGQDQVTQVPVTQPFQSAAASPVQGMSIPPLPASALSAQTPRAPAASIPAPATPLPNGSAPMMSPVPSPSSSYGPQAVGAATTPAPAAQPVPQGPQPIRPSIKASPFDSPDFQNKLQDHLAAYGSQGGDAALVGIKKNRDAITGQVMTMIANGQTDEARFVAEKNGLALPDNIYQNSDLARGLELAQKAYPEEPQKGQAFFQAFMGTNGGSLNDRVQAGMQIAGIPTPKDQRELSKAIALAQFNANLPKPYIAPGGGLIEVNPASNTATPVTMTGTGAPATVTAGFGLKTGRPQQRFINVSGVGLVDTQNVGADGKPTVVAAHGTNDAAALINITNHILASGARISPQDAATQAKQVMETLKTTPAQPQSPLQQQAPTMPMATAPAAAPQPVQVTGPATPLGAGMDPSQMVHVKNFSTGDEKLINPADVGAAAADGYQQVQ